MIEIRCTTLPVTDFNGRDLSGEGEAMESGIVILPKVNGYS